MTQQPNEQHDALVDAVAKALYEDEHAYDSSHKGRLWKYGQDEMGATYRAKAQVALEAVREFIENDNDLAERALEAWDSADHDLQGDDTRQSAHARVLRQVIIAALAQRLEREPHGRGGGG